VHSLELLNKAAIAYSGLLLATKKLAMHFMGKACGRILDLYVGYNKQVPVECSRDLTTF